LNNFSDNYNNAIDADFIEVNTEDKLEDMNIKKEPLYYTRVQVAKILDEKESTISYWGKEFQSLLNIKIINMTRKYTKTNIENLMFIQKLLRKDGLSIEQVKSYCSEQGFNSEEGLVDGSNPLAVQTFISAMTVEFDKKITEMENGIIKQQQVMIENLKKIILDSNQSLKQEVSFTVDEIVTEKINDFSESFNKELALTKETNQKQLESQSQKMQINFDTMSEKMISENTKVINEIKEFKYLTLEQVKEQQEPKSFISKLFNFKK
jgi:DNA-binding transcriptional MerR regulator